MKKMSMYKMDKEAAVSPIVATLVLIVVAVVGAVAVGTIMGTFSGDVSKKTNAGDASGASQTEILVAGSTSILPIAQLVAADYMTAHPGVKITVQGGGSGAGLSGIANKIIDVGMMSEDLTSTQRTAYPTVKQNQVGASGAVCIVKATDTGLDWVSFDDLKDSYIAGTGAGNLSGYTLGTRSDKSGTADTFGKAIGATDIYSTPGTIHAESGNGNLVAWVAKATKQFAFTDMDYASTRTDVKMVKYSNGATSGFPGTGSSLYSYKAADVLKAYNGDSTLFPQNMTRGFYLITNGDPNPVVDSFITFMQSPGEQSQFTANNVSHISQIVKS